MRPNACAEILDAAWELARTQGLAGLSLRDVARKIGMRPPSLYWYFDSKHAIYDAMFAEGNRQLLARLAEQDWLADQRALLRLTARVFVEFAAEDVERFFHTAERLGARRQHEPCRPASHAVQERSATVI